MSDFTPRFNRQGQAAWAAHELHLRHLTGRNPARSGPSLREQRRTLVPAQTGLIRLSKSAGRALYAEWGGSVASGGGRAGAKPCRLHPYAEGLLRSQPDLVVAGASCRRSRGRCRRSTSCPPAAASILAVRTRDCLRAAGSRSGASRRRPPRRLHPLARARGGRPRALVAGAESILRMNRSRGSSSRFRRES
jgi:hypothetical protein